jgi:putative heme-binding domain-containing protein
VQQRLPDYRQLLIDTGAALYVSECVECHADGTGVPGVNLRTGQFPHPLTDEDLLAVIRNGVPGTAMPPHNLSGADISALAAYVRSMTQDKTGVVKMGDPEKGKALFENEGGCLDCHRVIGKGSRKALNLSDAGTVHPPSFLQRALLDPNGIAIETRASRFVRAVTSKGTVILGRRLNEDTYTIQLMDERENLVSLEKDDLKSLTVLKESPMPSLKGKFTDEQISDVVAYLVSLKSTQAPAVATIGSAPAPPPTGGAAVSRPGAQRPGGNP